MGINLAVVLPKSLLQFPITKEVQHKTAGPITGPSCLLLPSTCAWTLKRSHSKGFLS